MKHPIETVALLVLVVFIGVPTIGMAVTDSPTTPIAVENQTVSISTSTWTAVSATGVSYADNETVYYNGSTVPTSEYNWSTTNGSIRAVSGGQLDGAGSVDISYTYFERQRGVQIFTAGFKPLIPVLGALLLFGAVGFLLYGLAQFGGGGGMR